jgi:hypothetical protein
LQSLLALAAPEYKGPRAGFDEAHVLKAIIDLGNLGRVGRGKLSDLLSIGTGEARTLIRRLKAADLIAVETSGCYLTEKGVKLQKALSKSMPWSSAVPASLGIGENYHAVILRKLSRKVRKGIEQRDAAIKAGAEGALTVIFESGKFFVPGEKRDCEARGPSEPWNSIRLASPKNGDTVIVAGAETEHLAEYGALSAALTLL